MKVNNMIDMSKITHVSEWRKVSELPSTAARQQSLDDQFSSAGIYQVAVLDDIDKIGEDLIHEDIGYIGKSSNIHDRTYHIRLTANSKTGGSVRHNLGRFIRQSKEIDIANVYVRYLYCVPGDENSLEQAFHSEMNTQFAYTFKWREASAGKDGDYSMATLLVSKLSNDDRKKLIGYIEDQIKEDLFLEYMND
jgi:hypothetical protein